MKNYGGASLRHNFTMGIHFMSSCSLPLVAKPFRNRFYPYPNNSLCSSSNSIVFFKAPFSLGINSQSSRFFPSRMNLLLEGISCAGKQTRSRKSHFLLQKWRKKHDDIHYTFTRLTKLKSRGLVVSFYPVLFFILVMEFLFGIFIGYFNYK